MLPQTTSLKLKVQPSRAASGLLQGCFRVRSLDKTPIRHLMRLHTLIGIQNLSSFILPRVLS